MGFVYALMGGAFFALNSVLARRGHREYRGDDGALITSIINTIILAVAACVILPRSPVTWSWQGFFVLILAGMLTTGFGRLSSLAAVRAIGPARATLFKVSAPLFTMVVAFFLLGERLKPLEGVGAAVVLIGLWLLTSERRAQARAAAVALVAGAERVNPANPPVAAVGDVAPAAETAGDAAVPSSNPRPREPDASLSDDVRTLFGLPIGAVYGLSAAAFFGTGFVARKWGLNYMPSAILGALIGASAGALTAFSFGSLQRGWRSTIETAIRGVPIWFILAGVTSCMALMSQFGALNHLSATMVSVFFATEPLWALVLGMLLFPGQETVTVRVVMCSLIIIAGVILMVAG